MTERLESLPFDDSWVTILNSEYCVDPIATTRALGVIARVHESTLGAAKTVDKSD